MMSSSFNDPILNILKNNGICVDVSKIIVDLAWKEIKLCEVTNITELYYNAIHAGNSSVLFTDKLSRRCITSIMRAACESNKLNILKWTYELCMYRRNGFRKHIMNQCFLKACWEGNEHIIKWILSTHTYIQDIHKGLEISVTRNQFKLVSHSSNSL